MILMGNRKVVWEGGAVRLLPIPIKAEILQFVK